MHKNLLPISKNGLPKIVYTITFLVVTLAFDLDVLSLLAFFLAVALSYIYRNPERENTIYEKNSVVSPVDGLVLSIESIDSSEYAYRVEIDSNYSDISILRVPMNSTIQDVSIIHGAKLSQNEPLFRKINENSCIIFEDDLRNRVKVKHLSKQSIESISVDAYDSQKFSQNTRYGFMMNGRTTLYLPHNFRLDINVGSRVIGSQTLIGYFS